MAKYFTRKTILKVFIIIFIELLLSWSSASADDLCVARRYKALRKIPVYYHYNIPNSFWKRCSFILSEISFPREFETKFIQKNWKIIVLKKIIKNDVSWYFINFGEDEGKINSGWVSGDDFLSGSFREIERDVWYKDLDAIIYAKVDSTDPSVIYVLFANIYYGKYIPAGGIKKFFFLIAKQYHKGAEGKNLVINVLTPDGKKIYKKFIYKDAS